MEYDEKFGILNFYRVDNNTTKNGTETDDFKMYKKLRDDSKKSFELKKGCKRKWMNESDYERDGAELYCLWPITDDDLYKEALETAADGGSPNNISPAIKYLVGKFYSCGWAT